MALSHRAPDFTIELPRAWQTAPFDPAMVEVIAEATLPKGRAAIVVMAMLDDGTNVLALSWDRGSRLARMAPPDWRIEERFTGQPPGPGEGMLVSAWRIGIEAMIDAKNRARDEEERDPVGARRRSAALWVSRHPGALDSAWEKYCEQEGGVPPITREQFDEGVKALGGYGDAEDGDHA